MASTAYTKTLWEAIGLIPPFPINGPAVPAGKVWVVRDVVMTSPSATGILPSCPPGVLNVNGVVIASTPPAGTLNNADFHWHELRQVVTVFDQLQFNATTGAWFLRVAGYELTA